MQRSPDHVSFVCILCVQTRCDRTAEWLALPTPDHEIPGSNPTRGGIKPMSIRHFTAHIITFPSSRYDLDNVERDIKHQTFILCTHKIFLWT